MKKSISFLIVFFTSTTIVFGQDNDSLIKKNQHEISFDIGAFYTPALSKDFYGMNLGVKYYFRKRFAMGFEASISEKKMIDTFSYSIQKPVVALCEFGWLNQFEFIQSKRIRIGLNINNGLAVSRLGDNAEKETYWTEYGLSEKTKKVAANYLYLLEPGIDMSIKLFHIRNFSDFYFTSKAKYRFVFGDCKYGQINDFSSYYIGFGISLIGF